jgi:hypothetical protein
MESLDIGRPWQPGLFLKMDFMMNRFAAVVISIFLGVEITSAQSLPGTRAKIGEFPDQGKRVEKEVGDVIYSKFDYLEIVGAELAAPFERRHIFGRVAVPAGQFLAPRDAGKGLEYCTRENSYSQASHRDIVCFLDENKNGKFEMFRIPTLKFGSWTKLKDGELAYTEALDLDASTGYRRDLLYQGISGAVIKLGYREYLDNLARPAFEQEVTYTLEAGGATEVAFRGARLRIFGASNTAISYEVLSSLRD